MSDMTLLLSRTRQFRVCLLAQARSCRVDAFADSPPEDVQMVEAAPVNGNGNSNHEHILPDVAMSQSDLEIPPLTASSSRDMEVDSHDSRDNDHDGPPPAKRARVHSDADQASSTAPVSVFFLRALPSVLIGLPSLLLLPLRPPMALLFPNPPLRSPKLKTRQHPLVFLP